MSMVLFTCTAMEEIVQPIALFRSLPEFDEFLASYGGPKSLQELDDYFQDYNNPVYVVDEDGENVEDEDGDWEVLPWVKRLFPRGFNPANGNPWGFQIEPVEFGVPFGYFNSDK